MTHSSLLQMTFTAPEVINSDQYRKSVDMWSLGCVLFFMYAQPSPKVLLEPTKPNDSLLVMSVG